MELIGFAVRNVAAAAGRTGAFPGPTHSVNLERRVLRRWKSPANGDSQCAQEAVRDLILEPYSDSERVRPTDLEGPARKGSTSRLPPALRRQNDPDSFVQALGGVATRILTPVSLQHARSASMRTAWRPRRVPPPPASPIPMLHGADRSASPSPQTVPGDGIRRLGGWPESAAPSLTGRTRAAAGGRLLFHSPATVCTLYVA